MKHGAKNRSNTRKILINNNVHTHARTHAPTHPSTHTLFFWFTNNIKHSINYNKTKFLKQQNTKIETLNRPQHINYRQKESQIESFRNQPLLSVFPRITKQLPLRTSSIMNLREAYLKTPGPWQPCYILCGVGNIYVFTDLRTVRPFLQLPVLGLGTGNEAVYMSCLKTCARVNAPIVYPGLHAG